jgi:hypothetical protein
MNKSRARLVTAVLALGLLLALGGTGRHVDWRGLIHAGVASADPQVGAAQSTSAAVVGPTDVTQVPVAAIEDPQHSDAPKAPGSVAVSDPDPGSPTISAAAARELMRERLHQRDCARATMAARPERIKAHEASEWRWLPPARAEAERQAYARAVARLQSGCPSLPSDPAEIQRRSEDAAAVLAAAASAGDLLARLESPRTARNRGEGGDAERALAYETVRSGDLEAIAELSWIHVLLEDRSVYSADYANPRDLWPLVACDLGLDCGPGSRMMDRQCLNTWPASGCGFDTVDALIQDRIQPWDWQRLNRRRNDIVTRIRNGQIAGLFDPAPATNTPGGG